jgi:hypothetical protein
MGATDIKLNILILDTYDVCTLAIGDSSVYPIGKIISNPYIEITPPGFQRVTMIFSPKEINIFNSSSLGVSCDDSMTPLPDGVYKIKYSIYPNSTEFIEKSFYRLDQLLERFDGVFLKINEQDYSTAQKLRKILLDAEIYTQTAISAAKKCNEPLAIDSYRKANKLLSQIECYFKI